MASIISMTATPLLADDITIPMPADTKVEHVDATYQCGQEKVTVTYINAGSVNLARLGMGDTIIVASSVIAASGAKYAGGPYVWWSKGEEAELYDVVKDPQMNTATHCSTVKG
ncbi:MliC family protein [Agrobacterium larrymoorei]|uniref:MliC family protein n=1 Tax=Agrobacterium larrymoorei TaxID=160699 RepID=UPI0004BB1EDF|nr:MliC family protein [Agrobacterium larrymoorei]